MNQIFGFINGIIFLFLGGIHFYWGFGGAWGAKTAIPQNPDKDNNPMFTAGIIATLIVGFGLLAMAFLTLNQFNFIHFNLPVFIKTYGLYVIGTIFLIRTIGDFKYFGLFKKIKNTGFGRWDTQFYTPLCLYLSSSSILIKILN
jgi:Protein of unknown function (DUF3995)